MGVKLSWHAGGKAAVTCLTAALLLAEAELLFFIMVYWTLISSKYLINRAVASSPTQADWNKKDDLMQNWSQTGWAKTNRCVFTQNFKEQEDAAHISGPWAPLLHHRESGAPVRMQLSRETVYTPAGKSLRGLPQSCTMSCEPSDRTCSTEILFTMFPEWSLLSLVNYETHKKKGSNRFRKSKSLHKCWFHIES